MINLIQFTVFIVYITFTLSQNEEDIIMNNKLRERLNQEERNAICCAKNMRCCRKAIQPPSLEIRAVLVRCPKAKCEDSVLTRNLKHSVTYGREHDVRYFQGFDEDEPLCYSEVTKCHKKLLITMKMKNYCPNTNKSEFIVVDHVFDPLSQKKVRLLNPYVIKVKQDAITQLYQLKFQHVVNSEAREVVYNKHDGNYTGCDTTSSHPTCGVVKYKGNVVPYSTGFCCSCDALKNAQRQPEGPSASGLIVSYSDPAFLLDGVECPRNLAGTDSGRPINHFMAEPSVPKKAKVNKNKRKPAHGKKPTNKFGFNKEQPGKDAHETVTEEDFDLQGLPLKPLENTDQDKNVLNRGDADLGKPLEKSMGMSYVRSRVGGIPFSIEDPRKKVASLLKQANTQPPALLAYQLPVQLNVKKTPELLLKQPAVNNLNIEDFGKEAWVDTKDYIKNVLEDEHIRAKRSNDGSEDLKGENNGFEDDTDTMIDLKFKRDEDLNAKVDHLQSVLSGEMKDDIGNNEWYLKRKRQVVSSGNQRRGGQNCADRYTPPKLNPETYHESTHCLRFSDLWYTVYHMYEPILQHAMHIQIFEKHEDGEGNTRWRDLTRGKQVMVGTFGPHYKDAQNSISIIYKAKDLKPEEGLYAINYKTARLLIPDGIPESMKRKYPEIMGGPREYLVVHPNQVSFDGDQCNMAGVGFEAFYKQPNRCSVPRGTCLANQPRNLWKHDHEAEKRNKRGCFFLKHYGNLPVNPIRKNKTTGDVYLALEYTGKHSSVVEMEIKADFNAVLRPQSSARITEVYIDSTSPIKTKITVKVTNAGLTSSFFSANLADCPLDMPAAINNIKSQFVLIPPQHQHIFNLEIKFALTADRFHCSVEVLNCKKELVALRRIRIQKSDRCICTWHCLCACLGSIEGLKCRPMSLEHYHAAGFQGALPVTTTVVRYTYLDDILSFMTYISIFVMLTLLLLGLAKALIGCCCCPPVGLWGLDVLLDLPRKICQYYECELKCRNVEYDDEGWPVHPDTGERVRNISKATEFCMNIIFFFSYPSVIFCLLMKRSCCSYYTYEHERCFEETQHTIKVQKEMAEDEGADQWQAGPTEERTLAISNISSTGNFSFADSESEEKDKLD